jgi:MoxR-like ATPase
MARVNNISSLWGRGEKLKTKPFANIESKSVNVSSKYAPSNRSDNKSMLIDAVINAVHEYIELLDGSSKFGAVGRNGNNIYIERSRRNSNSVQLLVYNKTTGVCKACNYNINENKVDPYQLNGPRKPSGERGTAIFVALLPVILEDNEAIKLFNEYRLNKDEAKGIDEKSIKLMATLCDNIYQRVITGAIKLDIEEYTALMRLSIDDVLSGEVYPNNILLGEFNIFIVGELKDVKVVPKLTIKVDEFKLELSRVLTQKEEKEIIEISDSHRVTASEIRICKEIKRNWDKGEMKIANILLEGDAGSGKTQLAKALSYDLGIPYTKVTCFADMDKSDVIGSILPVTADDDPEDRGSDEVEYKFFPSEIVRAFKYGYILEIQEPTVIKDAAVLMSLNSALELDGTLNLPTGVIHRHPDFIAVVTTNRNYIGGRPLNEALRDRIQHTEKMDLPPKEIMVQRAMAKVDSNDIELTSKLADAIITLDKTAKANAIRGVAGMRSLFFWLDSILNGESIRESMYHKVIYKMTTDADEIIILEEAVENNTSLFIEPLRRG